MRIRGVGIAIAMFAVLTILVGATAGVVSTRNQEPHSSIPRAAVSATALPLDAATPWGREQQLATYASPVEREVSDQRAVDTRALDAGVARRFPEPEQSVEKNAAYSAGNGAPPDGAVGGNIPGKAQLKYPNLGSRLNNLVVQVEEGAASTRDAEDGAGVQGDGSIAVTVHLSGNVADVLGFLENNGADPRNVGEDYIEAYVAVTLLGRLSEQPGVLRVREIIPPQEDR